MAQNQPAPRVVVLKRDRLYGDLISQQVRTLWRHADVLVFQLGFDALDCIQARVPDLFITGAKLDDMDGLEHLEPFIDKTLPILVVTSRKDARTFAMLRELRFDGIFDGHAEGLNNLPAALEQVMERRLYVSPSVGRYLRRPRNVTLDALTPREQEVLSVVGDGSDDMQAAERLGMAPKTVGTHRKAIMRKLRLHHKGELMLHAFQNGYVEVTPTAVFYPGFQRRLRRQPPAAKPAGANEALAG